MEFGTVQRLSLVAARREQGDDRARFWRCLRSILIGLLGALGATGCGDPTDPGPDEMIVNGWVESTIGRSIEGAVVEIVLEEEVRGTATTDSGGGFRVLLRRRAGQGSTDCADLYLKVTAAGYVPVDERLLEAIIVMQGHCRWGSEFSVIVELEPRHRVR